MLMKGFLITYTNASCRIEKHNFNVLQKQKSFNSDFFKVLQSKFSKAEIFFLSEFRIIIKGFILLNKLTLVYEDTSLKRMRYRKPLQLKIFKVLSVS